MDRAPDRTGPWCDETTRPVTGARPRPVRRLCRSTAVGLILALSVGCGSFWPTSQAAFTAAPADVLACAASQAKALGYRVLTDSGLLTRLIGSAPRAGPRDSLTAEKTLPLGQLSSDVTEYSRKNVLVVTLPPNRSTDGSTMVIRAETVSIQESRRGMTDIPVPATGAVRTDADTLLAHCHNPAPNTSMP
jgi:hypothetical protein